MTASFSDIQSAKNQQILSGGNITRINESQTVYVDEQDNDKIENYPAFYVLTRTSKNGDRESWDEKSGWIPI